MKTQFVSCLGFSLVSALVCTKADAASSVAFSHGKISGNASDVVTGGILVYAYDLGSGLPAVDPPTNRLVNPEVNGVTFVTQIHNPTTATGSVGHFSWVAASQTFGDATPDYAENLNSTLIPDVGYLGLLADGFSIAGSAATPNVTITLGNLVAGETYIAQFWFQDSRSARDNADTTVTNAANTSEFVTVKRNAGVDEDRLGSWVTATFEAESDSASFTLSGGGYVGINALQVIQIPEPSSFLLGLVALPAFLRRRR